MRPADFLQPCSPRTSMPQVDERDLLQLLVWLAQHNVDATSEQLPVAKLIFHQHVYPERIPPRGSELLNKPLLVSSDNYILDGNHRAAAHRLYGTSPVVFKLSVPFQLAIQAIFTFPHTYTYERA